ncbi:MAG: outer membrane lipoprotein chaperone LolA [Porticoccus sp.]|jgi:outer membrane lipoprotein carrier protein|nr:outer membrane lipoprotein chaperone LolA [Porticoccus sp.]
MKDTLVVIFLVLIWGNFAVKADGQLKNDIAPTCTASLQDVLSSIRTIDTDFKQITYTEKGEIIQEVEGHLIAERPGNVSWITRAPMEQHIISDNENLWIYDPDLQQVSIGEFNHELSKNPAILLVGSVDNIELSYNVSCKHSSTNDFLLTPVATDSLYQKLEMSFINKTPVSMVLSDSLSYRTEIDFIDTRMNQILAQKSFQFSPPEGVDIIRYK